MKEVPRPVAPDGVSKRLDIDREGRPDSRNQIGGDRAVHPARDLDAVQARDMADDQLALRGAGKSPPQPDHRHAPDAAIDRPERARALGWGQVMEQPGMALLLLRRGVLH